MQNTKKLNFFPLKKTKKPGAALASRLAVYFSEKMRKRHRKTHFHERFSTFQRAAAVGSAYSSCEAEEESLFVHRSPRQRVFFNALAAQRTRHVPQLLSGGALQEGRKQG